MNKKILNCLAKRLDKKPEEMTKEDIYDVLCSQEVLHQEMLDNHAHFTDILRIICIDNIYISYVDINVTGDTFDFESWCEFNFNLDEITEVRPVEKTTIVYEPV